LSVRVMSYALPILARPILADNGGQVKTVIEGKAR
jgi:hypothetical protein